MPNAEAGIVVVNIFEREFKIKCPEDKVAELQKAAKYLNEKMQEVRRGDRFITIDRIAITAALNIAHELILEKQHLHSSASSENFAEKHLISLQQKLDQALASVT
jgi:cell division protein ZapA